MGEDPPSHGFGKRVQEVRTQKGLSLEKLAEMAGLDRTAIGLIERGLRDPLLTTAVAIASALQTPLPDLIRADDARRPAGVLSSTKCDALQGLDSKVIGAAIGRTYDVLDMLDRELLAHGAPPLSQLLELANLSAVVGNIFGGEVATLSGGSWKRNGPHKHPDLLKLATTAAGIEVEASEGIEIKVALEGNNAKGHLPKPGAHITLHYVLTHSDPARAWTRGERGDRVSIWMVKAGWLAEEDFNISNTEGDSGKTAVINAAARDRMDTVYFDPNLCPMPSLLKKFQKATSQAKSVR